MSKSRRPGHFISTLEPVPLGRELAIHTKIVLEKFEGDINKVDNTLHELHIEAPDLPLGISIVVLDASLILRNGQIEKFAKLKGEVVRLWQEIDASLEEDGFAGAWQATERMSKELKKILEKVMIGNTSFGYNGYKVDPQWKFPYDFIASLKALYVLLDQGTDSKDMRQGAKRHPDSLIIVGTSGLVSSDDEKVSDKIALSIKDHEKRQRGHARKIGDVAKETLRRNPPAR